MYAGKVNSKVSARDEDFMLLDTSTRLKKTEKWGLILGTDTINSFVQDVDALQECLNLILEPVPLSECLWYLYKREAGQYIAQMGRKGSLCADW